MKNIYIKYWDDEMCRDAGMSEVLSETFNCLDDAIDRAYDLFMNYNKASVEVLDKNIEDRFYAGFYNDINASCLKPSAYYIKKASRCGLSFAQSKHGYYYLKGGDC